jgi:hypothetical protein
MALGLGLVGFWAGCALVKALSSREAFVLDPERVRLRVDTIRLLAVFVTGIAIFI